jgi:type I restriction enzyme S subunit
MNTHQKARVADRALVLMGQSPPSSACSETGDGLPFIQGNAEFGVRYPVPRLRCSAPTRVAQAGDLLLSVRAPVGEVNQATTRTVIGRGLSALRFSVDDQGFAWHALKWSAEELNRLAQGSTFVAVSRQDVENLEIPWHGAANKHIGAVLDTVDEAIGKTEAVIAKLKQVRAGLLHDLLTRGLDAHGQLRDPVAHPNQFQDSPLGRIPKDWEVVTADSLCSEVVDCPHWTPTYVSDGIPCIRTADIRPGELVLHLAFRVDDQTFRDRTVRLVPQEGDVIYSREGERLGIAAPVGRERVCLGQRVMLMRPKPETDPMFLLWTMNTFSFYQQALVRIGATTSPHVNVGDVRGFLILRAPSAEQTLIGNAFRTAATKINSEEVELRKLGSLKRALMSDLLSGRVRVPEGIAVTG